MASLYITKPNYFNVLIITETFMGLRNKKLLVGYKHTSTCT